MLGKKTKKKKINMDVNLIGYVHNLILQFVYCIPTIQHVGNRTVSVKRVQRL